MAPSIDDLFEAVRQTGASDLVFTPGAVPAMWVAGRMQPFWSEVVTHEVVAETFLPLLNVDQRNRLAETGDVDLSIGRTNMGRFRINIHRQRDTLSAAMRFVSQEVPEFKTLNLPDRLLDFARLRRGLVLVAGGAATGKSTTLAALIEHINTHYAYHVITLEDPIEYMFGHRKSVVEQREIGQDAPSFASALRHVVRQRPDVVFIGEMRDLETISTALTAAETGYLVLATLHTNTAVQTIGRIIDIFPGAQHGQVRVQLSSALQGVCCQALFHDELTGGLIPAAEIMVPTPAIRRAIRDNETHLIAGMIETGQSQGMQSMDAAISRLVAGGHVAPEDAMANAIDPEKMKKLLAA